MTAGHDHLREYLQSWVMLHKQIHKSERPYIDIHDLVLRHGQSYYPGPQCFDPIPRSCFARSYEIATRRNSKWLYVEGYAINTRVGLPVAHAWITPTDSKERLVCELAWETDPGNAYLGIPFKAEYVKRIYRESKRRYFSVLDAWWAGYPLITGEHKLENVVAIV